MKIESYKIALLRSFSNSTSKQEFEDNVSGIMNVVIEDDDMELDGLFTILNLREELMARFEGDVKT